MKLVLLTGGTGYIGGRLLPLLEHRQLRLRCLCRVPDRLRWRVTQPATEVVAGDVLEGDSLEAGLQGVHTAYYLVHSLGTRGDFQEDDRRAAANFGAAARRAGVERIIYRGGSRIVDSRAAEVSAPPDVAFVPIARIGGRTGWYLGTWLWKLRGWLDLLVGGVGLRRGRRHPRELPGRAWLQFEVTPTPTGSTLRQTAIFDPVGLAGLAHWYALYPIHRLSFAGMLKRIARAAVRA